MELQKEFQKDKYRHAEFLEMIPIKEEKLLKLFLKRNNHPIGIKYEAFQ
ncbi:MAG TPA: hypothetical protein VMV43_03090 [Candidatus Nanopelagicaceae bacterium]|nr:hypothetical protein [Candidatus Nanopelagicaceae bacterium]